MHEVRTGQRTESAQRTHAPVQGSEGRKVSPMNVQTTRAALNNKFLAPFSRSMDKAALVGKVLFAAAGIVAIISGVCGGIAGADHHCDAWTATVVTGVIGGILAAGAVIAFITYCVQGIRRYLKERTLEKLDQMELKDLVKYQGIYKKKLEKLRQQESSIDGAWSVNTHTMRPGIKSEIEHWRAQLLKFERR